MKFTDDTLTRLSVNRLFGINVPDAVCFYGPIKDELGKIGTIKFDPVYGRIITIGTIEFQILLKHKGDDKFIHRTKFKGIKRLIREGVSINE